MRSITIAAAAVAVIAALSASCDGTGPVIDVDFPFYFVQDIDISGIPANCCFLKPGGDGVVSGSPPDSLYLTDHQNGYVLARLSIDGYPIEDVGATAEGGYALAMCGDLLYHVSNDTYVVHEPTVLASYGLFVLTDPTGSDWRVYTVGQDGLVSAVSSLSWDVTGTWETGIDQPVAAVITADGASIFIADDGDDRVKRVSTADPGTVLSECHVPGGVSDMYAGEGDLVFVAADSLSELWGLDTGTGLRYSTYPLTMPAISVAVTPDGDYLYAGLENGELLVMNEQSLATEATASYGRVLDMAIDGSGNRALVCTELGKVITLRR